MISKRFVIKRLLLLVPVLFGVATFVFAILHMAPGDPARVIAGQRASEQFVQQVRAELGLNDPIWVQYGRFLLEAAQFDFGNSYQIQKGTPVKQVLRYKLPVTLEMALFGQFLGILFGIPIGLLGAVKQDAVSDHVTRIGALTGISVPIYWSGPLLILLFAQVLNWFPASGRIASEFSITPITGIITFDTLVRGNFAAFQSAAMHLFLPSVVIGIYSMALISRMMRSSMLEVIRQDYMRTARAKGQGSKITVMKHGFQNALIPVVTVIGIQFGTLLGGAVLTETVFGIPGIGTLLVSAIQVGDYPVVQGTVLTFAFLFTMVNLLVDVTYSYLDPRIDQ
ncbi:ABC transporter permease [Halorussus gelatinilyticus]|uniref:ABC transporter permease n=1 Tax=Halorussus gelatinilyticus TaxID=2937524 RepID=A0A8U0ING4_9EURY|nr:ABC transporter permease [Halorussus gelatinilyticus]UPW02141.1 ABC transporter permease [Halorussus gelatinilyticus]